MVIGLVGNQRAGKTLNGVALVRILAYQFHQRISSNIVIKGFYKRDNGIPIKWETWQECVDKTPNNSIIMFDEVDTAIDSRNFKSEDQLKFTHWFKQLGKRGITFFYTTQRLHMVEKRVREQTDYTIYCQKNWLTGKLSFEVYDTQAGHENGRLVQKIIVNKPERIYGWYDSFATVRTTMIGETKKYAPYQRKHY